MVHYAMQFLFEIDDLVIIEDLFQFITVANFQRS